MKSESVATVVEKEAPARVSGPGRWKLKAHPFTSERPAPRQAVQGELSLDKVKPLRNDLSDCDLELVPKQALEPSAAKMEELEAPSPKGQRFWSRVRTLFRRGS